MAGTIIVNDIKTDSSNVFTIKAHSGDTLLTVGIGGLAASSITNAMLADNSVTAAKIAAGTIVDSDIADDAVTTAKILDANVTDVKIATMAASKLTGALPAISGASLTALPATAAGLSDYSPFVNATEIITVAATAATGTINYDTNTQSIVYYTTAASGDWTVNFRASSGATLNSVLSTGEAITLVHLVTLTGSEFRNTVVQVDGSAITPEWQGGTAPTEGNINSIDSYAYTIIKTGDAAFTILAALTQYA